MDDGKGCGRAASPDGVPFWIVLSGVGAAWAMIGVGVGHLLGRRR